MSRSSNRVRFPSGSGVSLAGIVERPVDRDSVAVAVFSHCFTCSKDLKPIVRISRRLAECGITVLRFDMTGLGESEGDFSSTSFSSNLRDLQGAVAFAAEELGPVSVLLGHSFGGAASLALASRVASLEMLRSLRAVVTLAAPSDTGHLAALLSRMDPAIDRLGIGRVSIGGRGWSIRREMLEDFRQHDLPSQIAKVTLPTLIFHSPADTTVGFDHAIRIQSLIQGAAGENMASLVALPGADHLLIDDPRDLEFTASATAAFIHRYAIG